MQIWVYETPYDQSRIYFMKLTYGIKMSSDLRTNNESDSWMKTSHSLVNQNTRPESIRLPLLGIKQNVIADLRRMMTMNTLLICTDPLGEGNALCGLPHDGSARLVFHAFHLHPTGEEVPARQVTSTLFSPSLFSVWQTTRKLLTWVEKVIGRAGVDWDVSIMTEAYILLYTHITYLHGKTFF